MAQKEDYVWLNGYNYDTFIEGNESFIFDFKDGSSPKSAQGVIPITFFGNNASICDKEGNLLFYTNGCHVVDTNHEIMPNGSGLNDGIWVEEFMQDTCGEYGGTQNVTILNDPNSDLGYYILHKSIEYDGSAFLNNIKYTFVDLELNNGFGDVTEKKLARVFPPNVVFSSVEWSPNSRFLYVAIQDELWQVDTWEDDLEDGKVLIDRWNGVQDPFSTNFYLLALAPDCRIYMRSTSGTFSIHVINKPNEKGTACDLVQQGVKLPFPIASMPNFPRFRVDEEDKCDPTITSIFGDQVYYRRDMTVYPNPVRDVLTVEVPEGKKGRIVVFDMQGQLVSDYKCRDQDSQGLVRVDLSGLITGTYSVEFLPEDNKERLVFTAQIVKVE